MCQNKIVESGIDCMELCVDGSLGVVGGGGRFNKFVIIRRAYYHI